VPSWLGGGTTGKITGRIVDKNRQPLPGVNVAIPAAHTGAMTDADGRYLVLNVPAGTYQVRIQLLGYRGVTVEKLVVSADETVTLDQTLEEAPVAVEEVVVSAQRPVIDVTLTSTKATIQREEIQKLPVQELQDLVNIQAGVVDGHFRGGRIGEVQYQVDGVSVNNAYDNKSSIRLDRSLLEEVQVVSGTFDAEYGQAMSGVVNAVLRRGTDRFRWDAEILAGGWAYGSNRPVEYEMNPGAQQNYQLSVSGPLLPSTFFLVNGRRYQFEDYVTAERRFTPAMATEADSFNVPSYVYKVFFPDGDGHREALGYTREWSGLAKITNRSIKNVELNYQMVVSDVHARKNTWAYRLNPDGLSRQATQSVVHGLDWTHTLSKTTFYTVALRQNLLDYQDILYEDPYDTRYDAAGPAQGAQGYEHGAHVQGVDFTRFTQSTNTPIVKGTFTSQWQSDQQLKAGFELQWPYMKFGTPGHLAYAVVGNEQELVRYIDDPPLFPAVTKYQPFGAGAFVQNSTELSDLRVRAGLRFDYFNPRATLPSDLANPANAIDSVPRSTPVPASRKYSFAPRLGVSYPVGKDAALFFAYGHFYQMPPIADMFHDADYNVLRDLQAGTSDYRVIGNPDTGPEKTVQYQFGFRQAITERLGIEANAFHKDIRDLIGVEFIETYNGATYARATNVDFGSVAGITVSVDQRRLGPFDIQLDYTWQRAKGNSSDPRETATRAAANEDPRPRVVPFNWDQRHTLSTIVTMTLPTFTASAIVRAVSGQPFTPLTDQLTDLETNSDRKPNAMQTDVRAEQSFRFGNASLTAFGRVFNLFDTRFFNGAVFPYSGSPYYSGIPSAADQDLMADPTRLFAPRRVEIGLTMRGGGS
jgi:outer membrane receptor protein involved in Fe transport